MSRPRRLLFLAFWYPPSRASGVHRALAISRAFVDAGWEVAVVTVDERFLEEEVGSVDLSLLAEVPDGVEIRRVPFTTRRPSAVVPIDAIGRFRANWVSQGARLGAPPKNTRLPANPNANNVELLKFDGPIAHFLAAPSIVDLRLTKDVFFCGPCST